jgi:biopolymer transport protein ExbD
MRLLFLPLSLLLLFSCKQSDPDTTDQDAYIESLVSQQIGVKLPISPIVNKGPCGASHGILTMIKKDSFQVEDHPAQGSTDLDQTIQQEIAKLTPKQNPYLLIASSPKTHFKRIRTAIRAAARAGLTDVYFAIKKNRSDHNLIQSKIHLPLLTISGGVPELAPMFIKTDRSGAIYVNTGSEQEMLDNNVQLRQLPQLATRLKSYAAAARAGGHEPYVLIWADGESSYQRVIDVLSELRQANIRTIIFTDLVESTFDNHGGCRLPGSRKPSSPSRPIAPKFKWPVEK